MFFARRRFKIMFGVTIKNIQEMNKNGYRVVENGIEGTAACAKIIRKDNEIVAEISIDGTGFLQVKVEGQKIEKLRWIYMEGSHSPKSIVMEMKGIDGKTHWCELSEKENQPIFY